MTQTAGSMHPAGEVAKSGILSMLAASESALRKRFKTGTIDRGQGLYAQQRNVEKRRSLVETGRHAGRSRVRYTGVSSRAWYFHFVKRDFFLSLVDLGLPALIMFFCCVYVVLFFGWALIWWALQRTNPACMPTMTTFAEVWIFATYTQQTIGYGNYFPKACGVGAFLLIAQTTLDVLLDAVMIGVLYSRISHPRQRARTVLLSDCAVIARRDSILKFMFRVADIRHTQVVDPKVRAYLYTWTPRKTGEGEVIPVRVEILSTTDLQGRMLLPVIVEHTIDERSPLLDHTHSSLESMNAEVVVTFEGTTESGNPFMVRRSYLPKEIFWGYQFVNIIHKPPAGNSRFKVDIGRFHDIERQPGMPAADRKALSYLVVGKGTAKAVPYPLLGDNTLVLADKAVVQRLGDKIALTFRVADTQGVQVMEGRARVYLYRWEAEDVPQVLDYNCQVLDVGYTTGAERLALTMPALVHHFIDDKSPISNWLTPGGILQDADSEILLVVDGYLYTNGDNVLRQRLYNVYNQVHIGEVFADMCERKGEDAPPAGGWDWLKTQINWSLFHETVKVEGPPLLGLPDLQPTARLGFTVGESSSSRGAPALTSAETSTRSGAVATICEEGVDELEGTWMASGMSGTQPFHRAAANTKTEAARLGPRVGGLGPDLRDYLASHLHLQRYTSQVGGTLRYARFSPDTQEQGEY